MEGGLGGPIQAPEGDTVLSFPVCLAFRRSNSSGWPGAEGGKPCSLSPAEAELPRNGKSPEFQDRSWRPRVQVKGRKSRAKTQLVENKEEK